MSLARAILGTVEGIPGVIALDNHDLSDLYALAEALQRARNAVLGVAHDAVALEEGRRLAADHRRVPPEGPGVA